MDRAGTLSGTVEWIMGALESSTNANMFWHVHIWVSKGNSDAVRGTVLTDSIGATEWPTTATARGEGAKSLTSVDCEIGDRVVVEIGYRAQNTSTSPFTGTVNYGNSGTTDLASGNTGANLTGRPGWVEFSDPPGLLRHHTEALTDDFDDNSVNTSKWPFNYGTTSESSGKAQVAAVNGGNFSAYESIGVRSLADSHVLAQVAPPPLGTSAWTIAAVTLYDIPSSYNTFVRVYVQNGAGGTAGWGMYCQVAGVSQFDLFTTAVLPDDQAFIDSPWLRLTESGGTLTFDISTDGVEWFTIVTPQTTPTAIRNSGRLTVDLEAWRASTGTGGGATFDNFNLPPVPIVDAGADATAELGEAFTRTADETGTAVTARGWTIVDGPVGVGATIGTAAALSWVPGASLPGSNDIRQPTFEEIAYEITSTAENSRTDWYSTDVYGYIEDIGDERGYTAGIVGFCSGTGDMLEMVEHYVDLNPSTALAAYVDELTTLAAEGQGPNAGSRADTLLGATFRSLWASLAVSDPLFRQAQRDYRDEQYWEPALAQALDDGVGPLGLAILYDISINHGHADVGSDDYDDSFEGIVATAQAEADPPSANGDEAAYLNALVDAREAVLISWGEDPGDLADGRVGAHRALITAGNLTLAAPISWTMYTDPFELTTRPDPVDDVVAGTYTLRYTATNNSGSGTDDMVLTVGAGSATVEGAATASLGGLTCTAAGQRTGTGTASATLGALTATATASPERRLAWSGHTWQVREAGVGQPGPNTWGTTTDSVALDGDDLLLKIANIGGTWTAGEVDRVGAQLGYGRYRWTYTIDVEHLDQRPVLGLYIYDQDEGSAPSQREIDLEVTKWNAVDEPSTMWYSVHPVADGEDRQSDHTQSFEAPYTAEFVWQAGQVYFRTVDALGTLLGEHVVVEGVQEPGTEQPSMNLWLVDGDPPTDGLPVTARIHSFEFTPDVTHELVPADEQIDDFSTPWRIAVKDGAEVTGGELVLPCIPTYTSAYTGSTFDLRDSFSQIEISGIPTPEGEFSQESLWFLRHDADNYLCMFVSGGSFVGRRRQGGANTDTDLGVHDPAAHRFWRIEVSGTTVSYRTSPNGLTWTTLGTATTTLTATQLSALRHRFECGYWGSETDPDPLRVTLIGESPIVTGSATTQLGALTATAAGEATVAAAAVATLGALTGTAHGERDANAAAAINLGGLTATAAGTRNTTAAATAPLGGLTGTASAVRAAAATATADLGQFTAEATATVAVTGTATAPLGGLEATAAGVRGATASGAAELGALTANAAGTRLAAGTAVTNLGSLSAAATAGVATPGTATSTLGPLTGTASAAITAVAAGAATLGQLTASAAGDSYRPGSATADLGALDAEASATVTVTATAAAALRGLDAEIVVTPTGTADAALGALTGHADGVRGAAGAGAADLGPLTATVDGAVTARGVAAGGLGALTAAGTGEATALAMASAPLGALTGAASALRATTGSGAADFGRLTAVGTATGAQRGSATALLGQLEATGTADVTVTATASASFGLTAHAGGSRATAGQAAATLGGLQAHADATGGSSGTAAATLGALTAAAHGTRTSGAAGAGMLGELTAHADGLATATSTAAAQLGALTGLARAVRDTQAQAGATLGALAASASGTPTSVSGAAAVLGGLTAVAAGVSTTPEPNQGSAQLGGLTAAAFGARLVAAIAQAHLGRIDAHATSSTAAINYPLHAGDPICQPGHLHAGHPIWLPGQVHAGDPAVAADT
jgi:chitosanase